MYADFIAGQGKGVRRGIFKDHNFPVAAGLLGNCPGNAACQLIVFAVIADSFFVFSGYQKPVSPFDRFAHQA